MATTTPKTGTGPKPYRFTVRQFEKMIDAGVFREGERVELLAGIPFLMTKYEPHNFAVGLLGDILRPMIGAGYHVREEKSGRTRRWWLPEPDIAIARGDRRTYLPNLPDLNCFAWVAEVADTSYRIDRGIKFRRYAASRIPVYAVLDLNGRRLELCTDPSGPGKAAGYRSVVVLGPDDQVPVVLDGAAVGSFVVKDVLP